MKTIILVTILLCSISSVLAGDGPMLGFRTGYGLCYSTSDPSEITGIASGPERDFGYGMNLYGSLTGSYNIGKGYELWLDIGLNGTDKSYDMKGEKRIRKENPDNPYDPFYRMQEYNQEVKLFGNAYALSLRLSREIVWSGFNISAGVRYAFPRKFCYNIHQYPVDVGREFLQEANKRLSIDETSSFELKDEIHLLTGISYHCRPLANNAITIAPYIEYHHYWSNNREYRTHAVFMGIGIYYDFDRIEWPGNSPHL